MNKIMTLIFLIVFANCVYADTKIPNSIIKIIDGDTIEAKIDRNRFAVRLGGIDCFEIHKIHRAYRQAYDNNLSIDEVIKRGQNSKTYFEQFYESEKYRDVYLDFKGVDVYGRIIGIIYFMT